MGLFEFYRKAAEYVSPDPAALDQPGSAGEQHAYYHRWIVGISVLFGLLGVVLGVGMMVLEIQESKSSLDVKGSFSTPLLGGAVGILGGACAACAFAPAKFLTGPVGRKWMKLIGARTVLGARIGCLLLGAITAGPLLLFAWMALRSK